MIYEPAGIIRQSKFTVQERASATRATVRASAQDARAVAVLAADTLLSRQKAEGYWCGDLTADSTLQSDYILLQMWLYPAEQDGRWDPPTMPKIRKAARAIVDDQRPDGGWSIYQPGPSEINASVRAYAMLKMTGMDVEDPRMKKARSLILKLGGMQACNSYTKINYSFFDLFPHKYCPTIPHSVAPSPFTRIHVSEKRFL